MSTISVIIPALNEASTVAGVVRAVLADEPHEVIVIDADSTDDTAHNARLAGATVVNWREVLPDLPPRPGKGESLWRGVAAATGDIVVFVDADLTSMRAGMIQTLVEPFADPGIHLVKADYRRTYGDAPPVGTGHRTRRETTAQAVISGTVAYPSAPRRGIRHQAPHGTHPALCRRLRGGGRSANRYRLRLRGGGDRPGGPRITLSQPPAPERTRGDGGGGGGNHPAPQWP